MPTTMERMAPSASVRLRESCRLCDGRRLDLALQLEPSPLGGALVPADRLHQSEPAYPLDLFLCQTCGHLQLLHIVNPDEIYRQYFFETKSSPGLVDHFQRYADQVVDWAKPPAGALVVELGSNDGSLLRFFRNKGLKVLGVDPAESIAHQATQEGLETLPTYFTAELARRIRRERGPAHVVAANNVFAHIDDMHEVADGVRELLADDGVFVFEVSWLVDTLEKKLFDTVYHEHLCYHAIAPLQRFMARHGLQIVHVERIPTKGGSMRCFVQRTDGPRPEDASVQELLRIETAHQVDRLETYRPYAADLDRVKAELHKVLSEARRKGQRIAGYGISHTVTTLIHHFELAPFFEFLVDDNPHKQGLYSPGHHLPVLGPKALGEKGIGLVVILAWNYAQLIMERNVDFRAAGGRFVIPLPEVKIV